MHLLRVCLANTTLTHCIDSLLYHVERNAHDLLVSGGKQTHPVIAIHQLDAALELRILHRNSSTRILHVSDGHKVILHFLGNIAKLDSRDVAVHKPLLRLRIVHAHCTVEGYIGVDVTLQILVALCIRRGLFTNYAVLHSHLVRSNNECIR